MAEFYSARGWEIPPLPWTNLSPPFSHQISSACYYKWKSKFGGLSVSELRRNRELEVENSKLKRMYAEMAMENHALKDLIEKKL